jgi:hypothetical protein
MQQLYVNVGYGFVGLTGRVGILPEITIFTLKAGHDPSLPFLTSIQAEAAITDEKITTICIRFSALQ